MSHRSNFRPLTKTVLGGFTMIKKLLVYSIPIFIALSAPASATRLCHDSVIKKIKSMQGKAQEMIFSNFNDAYSTSNLPWNFADISDWPIMKSKHLDSNLDVVFKKGEFDFLNQAIINKRHRYHNNPSHAPVPEPATVVLLAVGIITIVSSTRKIYQ
jgi:hypothetical protein